jgi:hypothetical protein
MRKRWKLRCATNENKEEESAAPGGVTENPSDFGGNNLIGDEREKCFLRPKKVDFVMDSFVILSSSVC